MKNAKRLALAKKQKSNKDIYENSLLCCQK